MGRGGGRSGGSSGGGRSFGSGGGRSFGGRSGGSGSPGRGGGSSSRPNVGGSSSRPNGSGSLGSAPRAPRPVSRQTVVINNFGNRRTHVAGGRGRNAHHSGRGGGMSTMSLLSLFAVIFVLFIILAVVSGSDNGITPSTVRREPLLRGSAAETDFLTDDLGWIGNRTKLYEGMQRFYERTGVRPHLYITDTIGGLRNPSDADAEQFAIEMYDAMFDDEAHLLIIFFEPEPDVYTTWALAGIQAKTVFDNEARDILLDYIDRYYFDQNVTDEQFFSKAFDDASKRMMTVTMSPWIGVSVLGGVVILLMVLFAWWNKSKAQKNLEAQQTRDILNTPLETFGDKSADDLAKKYEH